MNEIEEGTYRVRFVTGDKDGELHVTWDNVFVTDKKELDGYIRDKERSFTEHGRTVIRHCVKRVTV